jgi:tetratricopeptide (TPR) repeat protein
VKTKTKKDESENNSRQKHLMKRIFEWVFKKYHGLNMRPEVKNGLIVGLLGIVAAIILAVATMLNGNKPAQMISVGNSGAITVTGNTRDMNIVYQVSEDSMAKEAIKELDKRIAETDGKVDMTRKELALITQVLKDLEQKTSGIQRLPDGRTLVGKIVSGDPIVIIKEQNAAIQASDAKNFEESLKHSQVAIEAYEQTKEVLRTVQAAMTVGDLGNENVAKLYWLATLTAQQMHKNDIAFNYAEKMIQANPAPLNKALYATTLFNLGKRQEALDIVREAATAEPNNPKITEIKNKIAGLMSGFTDGQKK